MRFVFVFIFFITSLPYLSAQTFEWVRGREINYEMNPELLNYAVSTSVDGTIWFGGMNNLVEFYTIAMGNLFIAQFSGNGNLLNEYEISGSASLGCMETDQDGNLYIAGQTLSELHFWDGSQMAYNNNFIEGYLVKVLPSGTVDWVVNLSSYFAEADPEHLVIYDGHVYLAHSSWSESNITEFDAAGNIVRSVNQMNVPLATGVALDQVGNIYTTGSCSGTLGTFGGVSYPTPKFYSLYLAKYNSQGIPQWVIFADDITCNKPKVSVADNGNIIWSGPLFTEATFDTITLSGPSWGSDFFITSFNDAGQIHWGFEVPQIQTGDVSPARHKSCQVMHDNSLSVIGVTRGIIDWGNGVVSGGEGFNNDILVLSISEAGEALWAKTGGGPGYDIAMSVDQDEDGNIYISGVGNGTIQFDSCSYTGISFYYPFLLKLNSGVTTGNISPDLPLNFFVYPNPANDYLIVETSVAVDATLVICNKNGQELLKHKMNGVTARIDLSQQPPGIYILKLIHSTGYTEVRKVVVI